MFEFLRKIFRKKQKAVMIQNLKYRQLDKEIRAKMVDGLGGGKE